MSESSKASPSTIELKIPVEPNMELVATNAMEVIAKHIGLSEEKAAETSMAIIEAIINAFEYADSSNDIYVNFIMSPDKLTVKVIDQGKGFESDEVELPNIDEKMQKGENKRGWGISLIKELVDVVQFESKPSGTTVTMIKHKFDELKNQQQAKNEN